MTTDKIYVVFDGFPPDDDWIDSTWTVRDWALDRLKQIVAGSPRPEENPHGRIQVFFKDAADGRIEKETIEPEDLGKMA
jgi:hypothetical protein